ncbi:MAG TPA: sialidase family protein [Candidatus Polarisedimenticolaceae bacterium]|nr:sialidase family protein [Candidatus Polarisedimenticolaceae bacterium]
MRVLIALFLTGSLASPALADPREPIELEREVPNMPPGKPAAEDRFARSPGARIALGSYASVQVNVDSNGNNIVGDAANEPSLTVNPTNRANIVVGWRQFDTINSDFRQAGYAYSFNGGSTWTFPGKLNPGVFRSDPVLDASSGGTIYYQSLRGDLSLWIFYSTDGGVNWTGPVASFGGDKNWLAVDRTANASNGILYGIWQRFGGACCGFNVFTRSTTSGQSWETPVPVAFSPAFGTIAVGPSGEVYATGIDGTVNQDTTHYVVSKSANAGNPALTPTFTGGQVNLGTMLVGTGPNPVGLLGQPNVGVNHAPGSRLGEVYVVGSTFPGSGDPQEVRAIRSSNGGTSWSAPVRVNDDPLGNWNWMAASSVAPNGRIDAIWNDTRGSGLANIAQLFYAYSWDGGATWSPNIAVTPAFDTSLGYPQQAKMGDYNHIVSDATGADAVYTATFNGEQDVYHIRLFPDCNGNGTSDVTDLQGGSFDCNANQLPDECESAPVCLTAGAIPETGASRVTISKTGSDLLLRWGASCQADDPDYAVYEGTLGSFTSHVPRFCSTGGTKFKLLTPVAGSSYYLVVPTHTIGEGSYGLGNGGERPPSAAACLPQIMGACTP